MLVRNEVIDPTVIIMLGEKVPCTDTFTNDMTMDIDSVIESLNKKQNIAMTSSSNVEDSDFTEAEKTFISTFKPEQVLIVYGTLAPGKPNHWVVEHIKGEWQKAIISGKLIDMWGAYLGYKAFVPTPLEEQTEISSFILFSDELAANWAMLDEFEGDGYRRIMTKFKLESGEMGVGFIYAVNV